MPVQRLGVEETAFAVATAEGGRRAPSILGVAAASTSTVVSLGRLRRAAGAHLACCVRSRQMHRERLPVGGARLLQGAAHARLPMCRALGQPVARPRSSRGRRIAGRGNEADRVTDICS